MTRRPVAWMVGALAVAVVLSMLAPGVGGVLLVLAVPIAVAGSILRRRPGEDHAEALRPELPGGPHRLRSFLVAAGVAVAFGTGLLGVSRAALGDDGLGSVTILLPPVLLFAVGYLSARSTRSLRFGLETGILAALMTLVAVAVVYGVEAAHWYDLAPHVSVLDGEHVDVGSTRAAVLDAVHPVILLVHLVFWLPWPVLGAWAGHDHRGPTPPHLAGLPPGTSRR